MVVVVGIERTYLRASPTEPGFRAVVLEPTGKPRRCGRVGRFGRVQSARKTAPAPEVEGNDDWRGRCGQAARATLRQVAPAHVRDNARKSTWFVTVGRSNSLRSEFLSVLCAVLSLQQRRIDPRTDYLPRPQHNGIWVELPKIINEILKRQRDGSASFGLVIPENDSRTAR